MIIMGIDPGYAIVGFGVISYVNNDYKFVDCGVITTQKGVATRDRLLEVGNGLDELIAMYHPDEVAVEELFASNNQKTVIPVAEARGIILYCVAKQSIPLFEYTPMQAKLAITGYGKADKKQMQQMVAMMLKLKKVPKPDDAADALAIALCHAQSRRFGTISGYGEAH